jgi:hypothetical protein
MILRDWLVSVAFVAFAVVGCSTRSESFQAGCKTFGDKAVTIRLVDVQMQEIDGVVARVGRFEVTSRQPDPLYVRGWKRDFGFLAEFPTARLQVRKATWENVVPMIGSFHSEGDESTVISGERRMTLFARIEYGVPDGPQQIRLVLRTTEGVCLVSDAFLHTVAHQ